MKMDKNGFNWMEMAKMVKMGKMAKIGKMAKMAQNSKKWQKRLLRYQICQKLLKQLEKS